MKTNQSTPTSHQQVISQLLGAGRGQYFDVPAPLQRRPRASVSSPAKNASRAHNSLTNPATKVD